MIPAWMLVAFIGVSVVVFGGIYSQRKADHWDLATPLVGLAVSLAGLVVLAAAIAWRLGVWYARV